MHRILASVAGLLLAGGIASAAEIAGEIAEISLQTRTIIVVAPGDCLCTGTPYVLAPDVDMRGLSTGIQVKLTYTVTNANVNLVSKVTK